MKRWPLMAGGILLALMMFYGSVSGMVNQGMHPLLAILVLVLVLVSAALLVGSVRDPEPRESGDHIASDAVAGSREEDARVSRKDVDTD